MIAPDIIDAGLVAAAAAADHVSSSVLVHDDSSVNLRWACNTLTTNGASSGRTVSVVAAVRTSAGVCAGTVTRSSDGSDVVAMAEEALAAARSAPPAEDAADLPPGSVDSRFAEAAEPTVPEALGLLTGQLAAALEDFRSADAELFGFAQQTSLTTWLGTSAGARRRHVQPTGTVELTGKSHHRQRSTYANQRGRHLNDLDIGGLAHQLRERLGWQARTVDVAPGRHDTILPATSVADLLIDLYWALDARGAGEGRTVFSRPGGGTRVGDLLSSSPIALYSDPHDTELACEPFVATAATGATSSVFDNGLDLGPTYWIQDGRLVNLAGSRHSAGLAGLPPRPGIDNLIARVDGGSGSLEDLVAATDHGLLVTSLWYIREVDPMTELVTGLTRDGVYLIDGGEVVGRTSNFRFNDSPTDLLSRIEAATETEPTLSREWSDWFTGTSMPAMRVAGFNMSTTAQGT